MNTTHRRVITRKDSHYWDRAGYQSITLIAEIIRGTPALPGAACRQQPELFDDDGDHAQAITLCQACPALDACRRWAEKQPRARVTGVVAGTIRKPTMHRRKATTA